MSFTKLVKGATKIKIAPPKEKYTIPILSNISNETNFIEIINCLNNRINNNNNSWPIIFKSLVVLHLIAQENESMTFCYLGENLPQFFNLSKILRSSKWSQNDLKALSNYNNYLKTRCNEYNHLKNDSNRMAEVESLENQIISLIKNKYSRMDLSSNDLLFFTFRLLVKDLLHLYNKTNENMIKLLESFFELEYKDAERTLNIYEQFVELTEYVVKYLKVAKSVGLDIPVIKHITTKLVDSLKNHLDNSANTPRQKKIEPAIRTGKEPVSQHKRTVSMESTSLAQHKLEQIREQKRILQQQLESQQQLLITPTLQQQSTNPFTPQVQSNEVFSFENPQVQQQPTSNPFLTQQQQQQIYTSQTMPLQNVQTGYYSTNLQVTPTFTGAGFGGYTETPSSSMIQSPSSIGKSNNPFALSNIAEEPQSQQQYVGSTLDPGAAQATGVTYMAVPVQFTYNPFQPQQGNQQNGNNHLLDI
ncbi:hypothetical protein KAFR_0B04350 [Kazachstania africana CBS 2517]|uniref:ENTH domain-containing protein n=1 Tax=Kazachstania africana (strain ATCC 22294 / BCRC 22015 / CBS 2517 / CECT 1963 / NBRC 1671 / NRRL Y-8276) TaxID=1071382 RepID=H2AQT1_KAZAF|nr:hypothetical protein KAFR_0B04350 [Kazachstania africana CBS 2517]CCF56731.1 hypothetical protein KAFR_0B04350 [Kazachstania africana CBS 2517]